MTAVPSQRIALHDSIADLELTTVRELSVNRLPSTSEPWQPTHVTNAAITAGGTARTRRSDRQIGARPDG